MRKRSVVFFTTIVLFLLLLVCLFVACNTTDDNDNNADTENGIDAVGDISEKEDKTAMILSVDGGSVDKMVVSYEVASNIEYVDFSGKLSVSKGSSWQLYGDMLGQQHIPTKYAGNLQNGNNTFYIVVNSSDGNVNRTYTLNIWKNYKVTVQYYVLGSLIKTKEVDTHTYLSNSDVVPLNYDGYTFNGWNGEGTFVIANMRVEANMTPNTYAVTLDPGEGTLPLDKITQSVTYADLFVFPTATREGYTFAGWYKGNLKITNQMGSSVANWSYANNETLSAKWTINQYNVEIVLDDESGGIAVGDGRYDYGTAVTLTATNKVGYAYLGWYEGENKVSQGSNLTYTFNVPAKDVSFTARFQLCNAHTFDSNCVCTKCQLIQHSPNEDCVCSRCGKTVHGAKENGYCRHDNYIYFGSYPQTEVTDQSIIAALNDSVDALPTSSFSTNNGEWTAYDYYERFGKTYYMWYTDVAYSGEKYRGVCFNAYRPISTDKGTGLNNSCIDDNGYVRDIVYWFKYEPIKWRVLSEEAGEALIASEIIVDGREFYNETKTRTENNETIYANNYKYSTIRAWLNETFFNTAFSQLQKQLIVSALVDNNVGSTTDSGNHITQATDYICDATMDTVFLLSEREVTSSAYGFSNQYNGSDEMRVRSVTDYALIQGVQKDGNGNAAWWLRTPKNDIDSSARQVDRLGIAYSGCIVTYTNCGVVPALRLKLS